MEIIGHLVPVPPYDFALSLDLLWLNGVLDREHQGEYWRALDVDNALVLLRVVNSGTISQPALTVYRAAATGPIADEVVLGRARQMLNIDLDMRPFYERARQDEALWSVVAPLVGFRPVRAASLFEALITAVIEQQITLKLAKRAEHHLIAWADHGIDHEGRRYHAFPRPDHFTTAAIDDLLPLKITRSRIGLILDIARQHAPDFAQLEAAAARQTLLQIKGIGPWTATWAIIRAWGDYIAGAENDVALQAAINHYFFASSGRASPSQVTAVLRCYDEYAGAAAFHILMRWAKDHYSPEAT